jgi:hypothetical protein
MSEEQEDIDLLALQRQLDDAFETTRPRRGFDDELWLRLQARRPFWRRLQDGLAGLFEGIREVPAVPAAAVAIVLIVVISAGVVSLSGFHLGAGSTATSTQYSSNAHPGAAQAAPAQAPASFGRLPSPTLSSTSSSPVDFGPSKLTSGPAPAQAAPAYPVYLGPATLTWAGVLNVTVTQAPVFRYLEPTAAFAGQFAVSLGAVPASSPAAGDLGTYSGQGFTLNVRSSSGAPPGEPFFVLTPTGSAQSNVTGSPTDVANALLAAHNLLPSWPFQLVTGASGDQVRVNFLRQFAIPGQGVAYLVDGVGERYGLAVDLKGGQPVRAAGPLPVSLEAAGYPIITADQAVHTALVSSPAGPATINPPPEVQLTTAELVYAVVHGGDTLARGSPSFYEPCYLFSGTFTDHGTTYMKRVLVPAVDPSQRSS